MAESRQCIFLFMKICIEIKNISKIEHTTNLPFRSYVSFDTNKKNYENSPNI